MATETSIANLALGKLGGAGDALNGNAFIESIDGSDKVSTWCKFAMPRIRRRVIKKLAILKCPFRSTVRFRDLGAELDESALPEIGQYEHAFNLPGDCLEVTMQFNENFMQRRQAVTGAQSDVSPVIYQYETIANKAGSGKILLTNIFSNLAGDSAFIEYVIDTPKTGGFSEELIDAIATLLASEVAPVLGRDMEASREMLLEYINVALPNAQAANRHGLNNSVRPIPDYSGGRSGGGVQSPAVFNRLGTYIDVGGNRKAIF